MLLMQEAINSEFCTFIIWSNVLVSNGYPILEELGPLMLTPRARHFVCNQPIPEDSGRDMNSILPGELDGVLQIICDGCPSVRSSLMCQEIKKFGFFILPDDGEGELDKRLTSLNWRSLGRRDVKEVGLILEQLL